MIKSKFRAGGIFYFFEKIRIQFEAAKKIRADGVENQGILFGLTA